MNFGMRLLLVPFLLIGCTNPCVDMCQQIDAWLEECGTTWEVSFEDEGWESIDDCYDAHWEADKKAQRTCTRDAKEWAKKECY
jgi:hypothetical protein